MEYIKYRVIGVMDYVSPESEVLNFSGTDLVFHSHKLNLDEDTNLITLDGSYYTTENDLKPIARRTYTWSMSDVLSAGIPVDPNLDLADNLRLASRNLFLSLSHHSGAVEI